MWIRAFLDSGSNMTAISKKCAEKCGLKLSKPESIHLSTFQNKMKKQLVNRTSFNVFKDTSNSSGNLSMHAYVLDQVMSPINAYPVSRAQRNYFSENNIELSDPDAILGRKLEIDMLIGQEFIHHFYDGEHKFTPFGSCLIKTWGGKHILAGPVEKDFTTDIGSQSKSPRFLIVNSALHDRRTFQVFGYSKKASNLIKNAYSAISSEDELEIVEQFRSLELLGISPADFSISPLLEDFNETTKLVDGSYVVKLPTKEPQIKNLSNNFFQAFSRLMSGMKRRNKPKFAEEAEKYKKSFEDEIARGVLEKVEELGTVEEVCKIIQNDPYFFNRQKSADGTPRCYLPHQCVYKASNGKFRRVHDARARPGKGCCCLNDCLHKGPNLIATILQVLLGFRKNKYGYSADIEKAFPTVVIAPEHRDLLRCLWVEGDKVVVYRFARLPFGLCCSPYLLSATLRKHMGDNCVSEDLMSQFIGGVYMDDLVSSEKTVSDMRSKKDYITQLFGQCGMRFRDWNTNHESSQKLFADLEEKNVSELFEQLVLGMKWDTKGDTLRANTDRLKDKISKDIKTKRDMWKIIPSLYDPMGLLSPFCLLGKKIIMEACQEVKNWDSKMPQKFIDKLKKWAEEFSSIENITWPRFAGIENPTKVELYGCCDASDYAMGGCIYLVSTDSQGKIHSNLVLGKTRNKPSNIHTTPRLELTSSVLLTNMMEHVQKVYQVAPENIHFFSDSSIVIDWLYSGDTSFKPFVANAIKKILKKSIVNNWHHISGKENPADLASRGAKIQNLLESDLWKHGPKFWLSGDIESGCSPINSFDEKIKAETLKETTKEISKTMKKNLGNSFGLNKKKNKKSSENDDNFDSEDFCQNIFSAIETDFEQEINPNMRNHIVKIFCKGDDKNLVNIEAFNIVQSMLDTQGIHNLIDINNIPNHSYETLMSRTNTWINFARYIIDRKWDKIDKKWVPKLKAVPENIKSKLDFCDPEFGAELLWIQSIQRQHFGEVFTLLEKPRAKVSSVTRSLVRSHAIFLDKDMNVLRCTTRNERSMLSYSGVYPILLPGNVKTENGYEECTFSKMLVLDRHEKLAHSGTPSVLANLRSEFWILRGKSFVNKIIKKCVTCNRHGGAFYSKPPEPALPEFRVVRSKPFAGTGIDFVGPFKCKDTPKGKSFKAWYVTFACGNTRAVHVEAVRSRKVEDFIFALDRFFNEHGLPESFISDHEKTFKKAAECLEQIAKSSRVKNYLAKKHISWNFYTERSPNKGGFLERLNGPIKQAFYKSVGRQTTNFEEFRTLATHVKAVLNDRPITYLMSDIETSETSLSPSMLLRGYNLNESINLNLRKLKQKPEEGKLCEQYYISEKLKDKFWRVWNHHYLTELFERHTRNKKAQKAQVVPQIGEVVIISQENIARRNWPLGRVVSIKQGRRGEVRQVTVQTMSPSQKFVTKLNRAPEKLVPILKKEEKTYSPQKLIPLECGNENVDVILPKDKNVNFQNKYSKSDLKVFKRLKVYPPYKTSPQFINPEVVNTGPETDYVNKEKEIENELTRNWR